MAERCGSNKHRTLDQHFLDLTTSFSSIEFVLELSLESSLRLDRGEWVTSSGIVKVG